MGSSSYRICVCFTRKFKVAEVEPPSDVKEAFKKYAEGGTHMNAEHLRRFLVEVQGEAEATLADAEAIVQQILQKRHHIAKFSRQILTLDDFFHFLFSVDLNPPINSQVLYIFFRPAFWENILSICHFFFGNMGRFILGINGNFYACFRILVG